MLGTRDAHGLYRQFGFHDAGRNGILMEIVRPDICIAIAGTATKRTVYCGA